jgi:hypothetical protein
MYREVITVYYEQIKNRLYAGHACYYLAQNLLSFHLLSKSVKVEVQNVTVLSLLCGIETWPLALWEEHRLSAWE